jgi:CRISPR-associated endonuclease/helicase Cas3
MVCLLVEHARDEIYGKLKKYLFEVKKGVYFGNISGAVRDTIWNKLIEEPDINVTLVYNYDSEQGLNVRVHGDPNRKIVDDNGLFMVLRKEPFSEKNFKAKQDTEKTLSSHLYETGIMAKALLLEGRLSHIYKVLAKKLNCNSDNLLNFLCFISAVHDIGKAHPTFQLNMGNEAILDYIPDAITLDGFRHEEYGGDILSKFLLDNKIIENATLRSLVVKSVKLHHLDKKSFGNLPPESDKLKAVQNKIMEELFRAFNFDATQFKIPEKEKQGFGVLFTVVINLADWLASTKDVYDNKTNSDFLNMDDYLKHLYNQAIKFLKKHYLYHVPLSAQFDISETPYRKLFGIEKPREMQSKLIDICESIEEDESAIIFIEDVCGGGKTEASLYTALKLGQDLGGIMDCLPTSATSEQLQSRIENMFQRFQPEFKLPNFNSRAWLSEKDVSLSKELWLHPSRLKLLYPSAVGTVDQAIMAAQIVKYGLLRLVGYSDKAIIIDEMHSYDTYMLEFLKVFLEYCGWMEVPVIILSATLPSSTKLSLIQAYTQNKNLNSSVLSNEYPLITVAHKKNNKFEIFCNSFASCFNKKYPYILAKVLGDGQEERIIAKAIAQTKNGGCLDIIVNTVNEAQNLFLELKKAKESKLYDGEIYLIHGRFSVSRKESDASKMFELFGKEGKKKGIRPKKAIVISTQILEQSLDVDFDFTFSEICPIDLLIQRIGRQRRHDDVGTIRENASDNIKFAATTILVPYKKDDYGATEKIYDKSILDETIKVLIEKTVKIIRIPEDVRYLIEFVYNENTVNKLMKSVAQNTAEIYKLSGPYKRNFDYFQNNQDGKLKTMAPTRFSTYKTASVAIVPENIFEAVENPDQELCKLILKNYTYSIGEDFIKTNNIVKFESRNFIDKNKAKSFLNGIYILKSNADNKVFGKNISLIVDEEIGLVIQK